MQMRIVVADSASATALALRLAVVFGGECVALADDQREVDLDVDRGSDRAILRVLDAVERWLDGAAAASAELWLGEHSYRLSKRAPIATGL